VTATWSPRTAGRWLWPAWSCAGPLNADQLHRPARPRMPGRPNLVDATAAVAAVVGSVNDTAGPVVAALEARQ